MHRHRRMLAVWLMALAIGACGMRGPHPEEASAAEDVTAREIAERVAGYLDAIERSDIAAVADYWTEDAQLIGPGMNLHRSTILDGMRSVFDTGTKVDVLARETLEVFAHGDVAYELAQAEEVFLDGTRAPPDTMRNNLFIRWTKGVDGAWRFDRVLLGPQAATVALVPDAMRNIALAANAALDTAYRRGNADAAAALMSDSVVISAENIPDLAGRSVIRDILRQFFAANSVDAYSLKPIDVIVHGNQAFERGTFVWTAGPKGGSMTQHNGRYMLLRIRDSDGAWKIHRLIENCLPAPCS